MKHVVFLALALFLFCGTTVSQNIPEFVADTSVTDTTSILKELVTIRELQQAAKQQREEDIKEWKKHAGQPKDDIEDDPKSEAGMMAKIESNTRQEPMKDGWNLYGWVAFLVAAFSAIVALITFHAQSKTELHTKNAPLSAQIGRFKDLTRHLYRNLVCTSASIAKFNLENNYESAFAEKRQDADRKKATATSEGTNIRVSYPSESNFNKLKTMPDDVILNIDVNERTYAQMHELKVLLRNYNIEIDVASNHISNRRIWDRAIEQDLDNLLFKPLHLIKSAFEPEELMLSTESGNIPLPDRSVYIILEEHFKKLKSNFKALGSPDSFKILEGFFGNQTDVEKTDVGRLVKEYYLSRIDATKALNRSIDGFIKEAKRYDSTLFDTKKDTIIVSVKEFCDYLDSRDNQILNDFQVRLKENVKLRKEKKWSLLWPIERKRKKEEVKLIDMAISKLEEKLKEEKEKKTDMKLSSFVKQLAKASDLTVFEDAGFVKYDDVDDSHVRIDALHEQLCPYFNYIAREKWDFRELMYVLLAIDVAIEINRIGMVNYA